MRFYAFMRPSRLRYLCLTVLTQTVKAQRGFWTLAIGPDHEIAVGALGLVRHDRLRRVLERLEGRWLFLDEYGDMTRFVDYRPAPIPLSASLAPAILSGLPRQDSLYGHPELVIHICRLIRHYSPGWHRLSASYIKLGRMSPEVFPGLPFLQILAFYTVTGKLFL